VEELDPFLETEIKAMGYGAIHGKDLIPSIGELTPTIVRNSLSKIVTGREAHAPRTLFPTEDLPSVPDAPTGRCSMR
jgi:indolepyruvate ferredoxin oxidoreductase alpha subunit